jgi:hypothetical protein
MNDVPYEEFIDALCKRTGSELTPSRHIRFDLSVNGTLFSLVPSTGMQGEVDGIAFFGDVGALPEHGKADAAIRLLESNLYMVGTDTPIFCCHPERPGQVILAGRMPLRKTTADKALEALAFLAGMAADTRATLASPAAKPAAASQREATASRLRK